MYSEVRNKSVTFFILFWDFFLPTWPYQDLHVYLFLGKVATFKVFYLVNIKKFPPTCPYQDLHVYYFLRKPPTYTVIRAPRLLGTPEYVEVYYQQFLKQFLVEAYESNTPRQILLCLHILRVFHKFSNCSRGQKS